MKQNNLIYIIYLFLLLQEKTKKKLIQYNFLEKQNGLYEEKSIFNITDNRQKLLEQIKLKNRGNQEKHELFFIKKNINRIQILLIIIQIIILFIKKYFMIKKWVFSVFSLQKIMHLHQKQK